tara:strand:- start:340 stop:618 length:279 start_codon:yes stop_codon:yes gene_type:complete
MEIRVREKDRIGIEGGEYNMNNFIDVSKAGFSGLAMTLFCGYQYIEIRKKQDQITVFTFSKKSLKKEYDFGFWDDAEVVYSLNEQIMHKQAE